MAAKGTVLDANMIFDLCVLDQWGWISTRYGPLATTYLVWDDELDAVTQSIVLAHVKRVRLSPVELQCILDLEAEFAGILSVGSFGRIRGGQPRYAVRKQ